MTQFDFKQHYGRNLPHLQPPGATLFVTFRLAGSIPNSVHQEWLREKRLLESKLLRRKAMGLALDTNTDAHEKLAFQRRWFGKFEALLHANAAGPVWLKDTRVAEIVREALVHRDGGVYRLDGFCIMPNHVHAVFAPSLTEAAARQLVERAGWVRQRGQRTQTNSLRYHPREDGERHKPATQSNSLGSIRFQATLWPQFAPLAAAWRHVICYLPAGWLNP